MSNPQDTHASVPEELLVYESGNGDSWYLCEDPAVCLPSSTLQIFKQADASPTRRSRVSS